MPRRPLIIIANHVLRKDGNESRTERTARNNIKDKIRDKKCLQVGIGCATCTEDKGKH